MPEKKEKSDPVFIVFEGCQKTQAPLSDIPQTSPVTYHLICKMELKQLPGIVKRFSEGLPRWSSGSGIHLATLV